MRFKILNGSGVNPCSLITGSDELLLGIRAGRCDCLRLSVLIELRFPNDSSDGVTGFNGIFKPFDDDCGDPFSTTISIGTAVKRIPSPFWSMS